MLFRIAAVVGVAEVVACVVPFSRTYPSMWSLEWFLSPEYMMSPELLLSEVLSAIRAARATTATAGVVRSLHLESQSRFSSDGEDARCPVATFD
jgi:hypothetical protein